jgi:hypothetical protein
MTLNQIIAKLQTFATNHYQIKSFGVGDIAELEADGKKNAVLMWCFISSGGIDLDAKQTTTTIKIFILDLIHADNSNINEVLSDTQLIFADLFSWLDIESNSDDFIIQKQINLEIGVEEFDNTWCGWSGDFVFRVPFTNNNCQIPII